MRKGVLLGFSIAGVIAGIWLVASLTNDLFQAQSEADKAQIEYDKAQVEYDKALKDCLEIAYLECKNTTMKDCMEDGTSFKECEQEWWQDYDRVNFVNSSTVQQPQTNQKTTSGSMHSEPNTQSQVPNSNFLMPPPPSATQVQTSSNDTSLLRILSQYAYVEPNQSSNGILHVVGEVINESNQTAEFVRVVATFYDQNNQVIGTDYTYTSLSELSSGQKSPFEISLSGTSAPIRQMQSYTLALDWL